MVSNTLLSTALLVCMSFGISTASPISCEDAYATCEFKFEGHDSLPTFSVGMFQDKPFTSRVISKNPSENLGILNTNDVTPEFISDIGSVTDITAAGAKPPFTPTHFKPFSFEKKTYSGVGHQTFHGDQLAQASGRCMRVFFTSYQLLSLSSPYVVLENKHVTGKTTKCVVFRTKPGAVKPSPPPAHPSPASSPIPVVLPPSPAPPADPCAAAYAKCEFSFTGYTHVPSFTFGPKPDIPFTPRIVCKSPAKTIGILNMNNVIPEFINDDGSVVPITSEHVDQPFTPTHFKPYTIGKSHWSGIGHQTFHGNQEETARHRCIRVFFTSYQVLMKGGGWNVVDNKHVDGKGTKCVVFKTL